MRIIAIIMFDKNKVFIPVVFLLIGMVVGYLIRILVAQTSAIPISASVDIPETREVRSGGYQFINPLLECDNFKPARIFSVIQLENKLKEYIQRCNSDGKAQHISIYFRNLNSGPWIGINENEKYSPASLLKVPVAVAAMRRAEIEPLFLKKLVVYQEPQIKDALPNMNDTVVLQKNKAYTIEQLVEHTVADSDNEAMMLLLQKTGSALVGKVMEDMGIKNISQAENDFVSVKEYSSMFRYLFNATYLTKEKSELLLLMMSRAKYRDGLPAGIPDSIKIAHKFGERAFENSNIRQLHDCGIVYLPGSPYLICVMTRGDDFGELTSVIAEISGMIYREMEKGMRN